MREFERNMIEKIIEGFSPNDKALLFLCAMVKTALHEAAERGDSEALQRLLDEGIYDVNEEDIYLGV